MTPWEHLVREHLPVVTGVALRVLGDRAAAEDVAQDVFLHLLQNPHALDHANNVRSFLCRSAINRALDRIREHDRRERREAAVEHAPRDPNPVDAACHEEIRRSVEALPQPERDAVAARYFRGLTVREAAKEMQVSVGTVCNRLEAGVKRLRKWLGAAAFCVMFAVFDDDAFAVETHAFAERLLRRGRESGDGSRESGTRAGKRRTGKFAVATGLAGVAAWLLSLWLGRPGEMAVEDRRPLEIASAALKEDQPSRGHSESADSSGALSGAPSTSKRPSGEVFRAEGFLILDGDGFALIEPPFREPRKVEGPQASRLARGPEPSGFRCLNGMIRTSELVEPIRQGMEDYRAGRLEQAISGLSAVAQAKVDTSEFLATYDVIDWRVLEQMLKQDGESRKTALKLVARVKNARNFRDSVVIEGLTIARQPFKLRAGPLLDAAGARTLTSFAAWLDGLANASVVPHLRLTLRAAWLDREAGIAEAVEIEESEILNESWLVAWRDAFNANDELARAFELAPGADRRAQAMVASERLEAALDRARISRRGEFAVSWRTRRESELEIASSGAVACLGREEPLPEESPEPSDPADLAGAQQAGLELEPVSALQRSSLALRGGARILSVAPGSAADRAGLRPGDVVWRVTPISGEGRSAAREVVRPEDLSAFLDNAALDGWSGMEVEVVRGLDVLAFEMKM